MRYAALLRTLLHKFYSLPIASQTSIEHSPSEPEPSGDGGTVTRAWLAHYTYHTYIYSLAARLHVYIYIIFLLSCSGAAWSVSEECFC